MITDEHNFYYVKMKFRKEFELNKIVHTLQEIHLIFENMKKDYRHLKIP